MTDGGYGPIWLLCTPQTLDLHIHNVGVRLNHTVAYMQACLEADLRFLYGDHSFLQADLGVLHLHFALELSRLVLGGADAA